MANDYVIICTISLPAHALSKLQIVTYTHHSFAKALVPMLMPAASKYSRTATLQQVQPHCSRYSHKYSHTAASTATLQQVQPQVQPHCSQYSHTAAGTATSTATLQQVQPTSTATLQQVQPHCSRYSHTAASTATSTATLQQVQPHCSRYSHIHI
jgi:hypothetical protein